MLDQQSGEAAQDDPPTTNETAAFESIARFVNKLVNDAINRNKSLRCHYDDILADANMCAVMAIRKYEIERGVKLISFVGDSVELYLRTIVKKYFASSGIRIPIYLFEKRSNTNMALVERGMRLLANGRSIEAGGEDGPTCDGWLEDKRSAEVDVRALAIERIAAVQAAVADLSERDREVVIRRYGLFGRPPEGLKEIGESIGMSKQRVYQIERKARQKLFQRLHQLDG